MGKLSNYKNWDDINDNYIEPCQEYLKNTSRGPLYICYDRSNDYWIINLNNRIKLESDTNIEEDDIINIINKLFNR